MTCLLKIGVCKGAYIHAKKYCTDISTLDLVKLALTHISIETRSSALRISQHQAYPTTFSDDMLKTAILHSLHSPSQIGKDLLTQLVRQTIIRYQKKQCIAFSDWLLSTILERLTPIHPYPILDLSCSLFLVLLEVDPGAVGPSKDDAYPAVLTLISECPFELVRQAASALALKLVKAGLWSEASVKPYTDRADTLSKSTQTLTRLRGASLWGFAASLDLVRGEKSSMDSFLSFWLLVFVSRGWAYRYF